MGAIADMAVMLKVNAEGVTAGLKQAAAKLSAFNPNTYLRAANAGFAGLGRMVNDFLAPLKQTLTNLPLVGSAFAALPTSVSGFFSLFTEGSERILEMNKLALKLGADVSELGGIFLAAGANVEAMQRALFKMNAMIGQAQTRGSSAEAAFTRLGLSAGELGRLPLPERLGKIADAIAGLHDPTLRAMAAMSIFGKTGFEVLPILQKGSEFLRQMQGKAEAMGLIVTPEQAAQVKEASLAVKQLSLHMTAMKQSIAVNLAPLITAVAEQFKGWGPSMKDAGGKVIDVLEAVSAAAGYLKDYFRIVFNFMKAWFSGLVFAVTKGVQLMLEALAKVPGRGQKYLKSAAASVGETAAAANASMKEGFADMMGAGEDLYDGTSARKVHQFFDQLRAKIDGARNSLHELAQAGDADALFKLFEKGQDVAKSVQTPLEAAQEKVRDLNELLEAGAITWDVYQRATMKAVESVEALAAAEEKRPAAMAAGSKEAYSTTLRSNDLQRGGDPESRLANLQDVMKKQLEYQRRQAEDSRTIAEAVKGGLFDLGKVA